MAIFHMETEQVRSVAAQLARASDQIQAEMEAAFQAAANADWMGPSRDQFVEFLVEIVIKIKSHGEVGNELSTRVSNEIQEWERCASSISPPPYVNGTIPTAASLTGVIDRRSPLVEWLGDNTPLEFVPGFTPPAGGDIETIDSRLFEKFGRDVNLVDGNACWKDYEVAAVDRAVDAFPSVLAKQSLLRNIYRDNSPSEGLKFAFWVPPGCQEEGYAIHEINSVTFMSPLPFLGTRQGDSDVGSRIETTVFHELVHSAQYNEDGSLTNLTSEYIDKFGWSIDQDGWSYSGNVESFPGSSDSFLVNNDIAYPIEKRTGLEDMADAITYYRYEPDILKADSPERYEWIRQNIFGGQQF